MLRHADSLRVRFLRFAFHHFYNTFAWTYDAVSAAVSLGHWRGWTNATIPHLRGARVLEIAFGTGNLLLDMSACGIAPFGLDLSANMTRIAADKLRSAGYTARLARGSVLQIPVASDSLDTLVLTFPPNFLASPEAVEEMKRVLKDDGRIVLVDAGWLKGFGVIGALINLAFRFTGTANIGADRETPLRRAGFSVQVLRVGSAHSHVQVLIADKSRPDFYPRISANLHE